MRILAGILGLALAGCAAGPENPSFPLALKQARSAIASMRDAPMALQRPLVILGGINDPGLGGLAVGTEMRRMFDDRRIVAVSFTFCGSFEECRRKVIEEVDRAFPTSDAAQTAEVDVIGLSMGGLV